VASGGKSAEHEKTEAETDKRNENGTDYNPLDEIRILLI
jgi:hypothetical protein